MGAAHLLGTLYFASYLGMLMWVLTSTPAALCLLPNKWAAAYLIVLWSTLLIPLDRPISRWGRHFCRLSLNAAIVRHKMQVIYQDREALTPGRPYVVGYEPHSALPSALQTVFCDLSPLKPPGMESIRVLATSAGFYVPLLRHLWWWLGGRSADKATMHDILRQGGTVVLVPGGVQECAHMRPGREVAFLRSRKGFVRIALQHGAPLIPVFAFGQTNMLKWIKLGRPFLSDAAMLKLARRIGFLPLLLYGVWGSTLTFPVPVQVVIGKPIELPKLDDPSQEQINHYLQQFIEGLAAVFSDYKGRLGHEHVQLHVL